MLQRVLLFSSNIKALAGLVVSKIEVIYKRDLITMGANFAYDDEL